MTNKTTQNLYLEATLHRMHVDKQFLNIIGYPGSSVASPNIIYPSIETSQSSEHLPQEEEYSFWKEFGAPVVSDELQHLEGESLHDDASCDLGPVIVHHGFGGYGGSF